MPETSVPLLEILKYPAPLLKRKARPVTDAEFHAGRAGDFDLRELAARMTATMEEADGLGLAGPQVGASLRVFALALPGEPPRALCIFNPVLTDLQGHQVGEEGCLSVPGIRGEVKRAESLILTGLDVHGAPLQLPASGLLARACQHETDHLDGILFIQRLGPAARFLLRQKLRALEEEYAFRHRRHVHPVP